MKSSCVLSRRRLDGTHKKRAQTKCLRSCVYAVSRQSLAELRARRNLIVQHQQIQLLVLFCGQQHAIGLLPHHLARRQVGDGDDRLADKLLRLVILCDAGEDLARRTRAVIQLELEELAALLDVLAGKDVEPVKIISTTVVDRDNVDEYLDPENTVY